MALTLSACAVVATASRSRSRRASSMSRPTPVLSGTPDSAINRATCRFFAAWARASAQGHEPEIVSSPRRLAIEVGRELEKGKKSHLAEPLLSSLHHLHGHEARGGRAVAELSLAPSNAAPSALLKLPLLGSNQDSPDPEPSRAGLFGGHHVRKWLPAKHRRPQAWKLMPGLVRRNTCKTLAEASRGPILTMGREGASLVGRCKRFTSVHASSLARSDGDG
jgi:hypothetical protein